MYRYKISNGELTHDGSFLGTGYSGRDPYKNVPSATGIANYGPIPAGSWFMSAPYDDPHRGKNSFRLSPENAETFGRSGFLIHGDNLTHTASEGCIILGPTIRERMAQLPDRLLEVIE